MRWRIEKEDILANVLRGIRRRPTLPGRFQPSTISVLRLNFCVRDGNRWIPQAIVTGNHTEFGFYCCRAFYSRRFGNRTASRLRFLRFAISGCFRILPALASSAPSKPHRPQLRPPPDHGGFPRSFETSLCRTPSPASLRISPPTQTSGFLIKPSTD